MNSVKHDIDLKHDVTIGKTENLKTLTEICAAPRVIGSRCIETMLFAINLNDEACGVTKEVGHIRSNGDLTAKVRSFKGQPISEVPPQAQLRLCQLTAQHL
jgi:hypothetical protein